MYEYATVDRSIFIVIEFNWCKVKVKVVTLAQATKALTGSKCLALLFKLDVRWGGGWMVKATPQPLYPRERPGTHCGGG